MEERKRKRRACPLVNVIMLSVSSLFLQEMFSFMSADIVRIPHIGMPSGGEKDNY